MGDAEGARDILDEVIAEGTSAQQDTAREMIAQLG
jgi:pilus assembly protein FimV